MKWRYNYDRNMRYRKFSFKPLTSDKREAVMVDFDVKGNKCPVHRECYEKMMEEIRIEHDDSGRDE